jgi:hypothetical protein
MGCMCTNRNLFHQTSLQKCVESQQLFFGGWLVSIIFEEFQHPAFQTKLIQHFGRFFHQIKVRQPIGRKDSIQTVCRRSKGLKAFLYLAAQNFELFSNIQILSFRTTTYKHVLGSANYDKWVNILVNPYPTPVHRDFLVLILI